MQTAHPHVQVQLTFVRQDRLHAGRFANHAERRFQSGLLQILDEPLRAVAADFLVIADEQMERSREPTRLDHRNSRKARGDETLHVRRTRAHTICHRPGAA